MIRFLILLLYIPVFSQQILPYDGFSIVNQYQTHFIYRGNYEEYVKSIDSILVNPKRTLVFNNQKLSKPYDYMRWLDSSSILVFDGEFKKTYGPSGEYSTPVFLNPNNGLWGIIDKKGKQVYPQNLVSVQLLGDEKILIVGELTSDKDTIYGILNYAGKSILKSNNKEISRLNANTLKFLNEEKWGFINLNTLKHTQPIYDTLYYGGYQKNKNGEYHLLFIFRKENKYGFVNDNRKEFKNLYDEVKPFDQYRLSYVKKGYQWYVIKDDGSEVYENE